MQYAIPTCRWEIRARQGLGDSSPTPDLLILPSDEGRILLFLLIISEGFISASGTGQVSSLAAIAGDIRRWKLRTGAVLEFASFSCCFHLDGYFLEPVNVGTISLNFIQINNHNDSLSSISRNISAYFHSTRYIH